MKKFALKISSILLAVLLLLCFTACFPLPNITFPQFSYQVDNTYFEQCTYEAKIVPSDTVGNPAQSYVFEITSSCSVDLYQYKAYVWLYSQDDKPVSNLQTVNKVQIIEANEKFTFSIPATQAWITATSYIEVTFEGKSYTNPALDGSKQQVTVTFVLNNGEQNQVVTLERGQTVTQPTNPSKQNYYFVGWYTTSYFTTKFDFTRPITRNTTLYAKYELDSLSVGDQIQNDTLKSVVTIYNKCYNSIIGFDINSSTSQGSGFCFEINNGTYYILTNCHVALKESGYAKQSFTIVDYQGKTYTGYMYTDTTSQVAAIAAEYDLACLYFRATTTPVKALKIVSTNPSVNSNVISIGAPNGQSNTVTYGKIKQYCKVTLDNTSAALSNVTFNVIAHNADIDSGSSGGPLLNANLDVVGVNYAGVDNSTTGYAIPVEKVHEFLNKYVYTQTTKANENSLAFVIMYC